MKFECQKCGKCCRNIVINVTHSDIIRWLQEKRWDILDEIGYSNNEKIGKGFYIEKTMRREDRQEPCPFLKDNKCSIYDTRPRACADFPYAHKVWKDCPAWKKIGFERNLVKDIEAGLAQREDFDLTDKNWGLLLHLLFLARDRDEERINLILYENDPDETLWCNAFDLTSQEWGETGASPFLSDSDANYISSSTKKADHSWFGFANTAHSGDTLNSVYLYVEGSGNGSDQQDITLDDGAAKSTQAYAFVFGAMGYQNVDVSLFLDTWAKVDACTMKIVHENIANACTIRRAYLFCNYTAGATQETKTITADIVLVDRLSETITADIVLVDRLPETITADIVTVDRLPETITADIVLVDREIETITADIVTLKTDIKEITADIVTLKTDIKEVTADIVLSKRDSKTVTADIVTVDREIETITADIITLKTDTKDVTADIVTVDRETETITADIVLKLVPSKSVTADILTSKIDTVDITADILTLKTDTVGITADIVTLDLIIGYETITADIVLQKTDTKDITADITTVDRLTDTITADIVTVDRLTKTVTADIVLSGAETKYKTFTADIVLEDLREEGRRGAVRLVGRRVVMPYAVRGDLVTKKEETFNVKANTVQEAKKESSVIINVAVRRNLQIYVFSDLSIYKTLLKGVRSDIINYITLPYVVVANTSVERGIKTVAKIILDVGELWKFIFDDEEDNT